MEIGEKRSHDKNGLRIVENQAMKSETRRSRIKIEEIQTT